MRRLALLALLACGCDQGTLPPIGQVVFYVDTDAPVPAAPGDMSAGPPPLFDRLRVELFADGKPVPQAARDFEVHAALFRDRRVSIGVVPSSPRPLVAHATLFRGDRVVDGAPSRGTSLDAWVALPSVAAEGIVEAHVVLRVEDLGKAQSTLAAPLPAQDGAVLATRVGSWSGSTRSPCKGAPRPEEACAEGGAFWFGDPAFRGRSLNDLADERLVVLSPFFIDRHEVTVQDFRARWPELAAKGVLEPTPWTSRRVGDAAEDWCTWVRTPEATDSTAKLPLNCVGWDTAKAFCELQGKVLPSEAQFEYVASGLGRELSHPWGEDEPGCADAVWARSGAGLLAGFASDCLPPGTLGWMAEVATGARDMIALSSAQVFDLGGNLSEWARDDWTLPADPFWSRVGVFYDPAATTGGPAEYRPVRGGSWLQPAASTRASFRLRNRPLDRVRGVGFRCVRAG